VRVCVFTRQDLRGAESLVHINQRDKDIEAVRRVQDRLREVVAVRVPVLTIKRQLKFNSRNVSAIICLSRACLGKTIIAFEVCGGCRTVSERWSDATEPRNRGIDPF
jgi:hypothetical protein